jgi:hypothetical protein
MSRETTFRVAAAVAALLGLLLLFSSWDGLYDSLDLPRAAPALPTQIGSLGVFAVAYFLWSGASDAALARPAAIAGVLLYVGSAAQIATWLIFKSNADLLIGDGGAVALAIAAVLFVALGGALVASWRRG